MAQSRLASTRTRIRNFEGHMAYAFSINDYVHHRLQRPQGRASNDERPVYTVVAQLPIEADGVIRYRIKSNTENFERVVTEEQLSRS
jgi:hypothetical protein